MNKEELLQALASKISAGEITGQEVIATLALGNVKEFKNETPKTSRRFSVTKLLYIIGVSIVTLGILFFISQIWSDLGTLGRITITLGLGLLFTIIGSVLLAQKPNENIGPVFHCIGGILVPFGAIITLNELNLGIFSAWPFAIVFGAIFLFYLILNSVHKHAILTFFSIANATAFIYLTFQAVLGNSYIIDNWYAYLTILVGIGYLLLAYSFQSTWNKHLNGALNFFGITGVLAAAFSQVFSNEFWILIYFLFLGGSFLLSIFLKNRTILIMSTLFLLSYLSYITGKYFANSIGWPVTLVVLGFIFIGLGYASVAINKKYISNN